jgi:hypothetical protein
MTECPACGERVKPEVAVCKHCSAILNAEKAAKHGLGIRAAASLGTTPISDGDASGVQTSEKNRNVERKR